jgi:hypothetical protein
VERWLYPISKKPTTGDVGVEVIKQHVDALNPEFQTDRIDFPGTDGFYHVHLSREGKDGRMIYADPGTGVVFGKVLEQRQEPFATIYNLHRYFLLTSVVGRTKAASFVNLFIIIISNPLKSAVFEWRPSGRFFYW